MQKRALMIFLLSLWGLTGLLRAQDPPPQPIAYGQTVNGTINDSTPAQTWVFRGRQGERITARMSAVNPTRGVLDSYLKLLDSDGQTLAENDDASNVTLDAEISDFVLPATDDYVLYATRLDVETGTSQGDYELSLTLVSAGATSTEEAPSTPDPNATLPATAEEDTTRLDVGESLRGALNAGGTADYRFVGTAGAVLTFSVKRASGDLNPRLSLLAPDGSPLAENADFNGPADARLSAVTLSESGDYTVRVGAEAGAGEFVLYVFSVTPATPPPSLDLSEAVLVITLAWEGSADFDLAVVEPTGARLDYQSESSPNGGVFGGDANGACREPQAAPSETVYYESAPPVGEYTLEVAHVLPCQAESPVSFTLTVTLNGEVVETYTADLAEGRLETYVWTLED
jgi:hypothetical protein